MTQALYLARDLWRFAWALFAGGAVAGAGIVGLIWWAAS